MNPHAPCGTGDFKSPASASSATGPDARQCNLSPGRFHPQDRLSPPRIAPAARPRGVLASPLDRLPAPAWVWALHRNPPARSYPGPFAENGQPSPAPPVLSDGGRAKGTPAAGRKGKVMNAEKSFADKVVRFGVGVLIAVSALVLIGGCDRHRIRICGRPSGSYWRARRDDDDRHGRHDQAWDRRRGDRDGTHRSRHK